MSKPVEPDEAPLAGIKVLDLTRVLAGPWATQLLADLGADVIKIERPEGGDDTRQWGPPWFEGDNGESVAAYFACANRGKRSVAIDLALPEGADCIRRLAAQSDVVVENFKVGDLARYGLDYATLSATNPRLIYCSVTGFGRSGPYADLPGYDFIIQAMGGLMSVTGAVDGEPMKVGVAIVDIMTGLYACNGILAALQKRVRTGQGSAIDVSLFDVQVAALANQGSNYLATGRQPVRRGNAHPNIVPYQSFACADGAIAVAAANDRQFASLCAVLELPDVGNDPRYATNAKRVEGREELVRVMAGAFQHMPVQYWLDRLRKSGIPAGPVNGLSDVFADPHVLERGLKIDAAFAGGAIPGVACPIRFDNRIAIPEHGVPRLGEHTDQVLAELSKGKP